MVKKGFILLFLNCILLLNMNKIQAQINNNSVESIFKFENESYDFGKIPYGKVSTYKIRITNISNKVAVLDSVKPGCGCTKPNYSSGLKLQPNESTFVELGFNGYAEGYFSKNATIYLNGTLIKSVSFRGEAIK